MREFQVRSLLFPAPMTSGLSEFSGSFLVLLVHPTDLRILSPTNKALFIEGE